MNKHRAYTITMAILSLLVLVPAIPHIANAQAAASLSVDPSNVAGSPGDSFAINVLANQVTGLVAYDVQLSYTGSALHVASVDFSGPFAGSSCQILPVVESFSDAAGTVRAAVTTFNGCTVDLTSPTALFVVNFAVVSRQNSPLHIATDSECACSGLAQLLNGNVVAVSHDTFQGNFFAEPNIVFGQKYNATVSTDCSNCNGTNQVVLISPVCLPNTETLPGFAFVVFDVVTPSGRHLTITSQTVFLVIGKCFTLTSVSASLFEHGVYKLFVTLYRGSTPTTMVPFATVRGLSFRVS